jgi:hypothetical protein
LDPRGPVFWTRTGVSPEEDRSSIIGVSIDFKIDERKEMVNIGEELFRGLIDEEKQPKRDAKDVEISV